MLGFFRRLVHSRVGVVITMGILGLIALAFALGDVTGLTGGGTLSGTSVAKVGDVTIAEAELRRRAQDELESIRQQNPGVDISQYIAQGGLEASLENLINGAAMDAFGRDQGIVIGKPLVDGQLLQIPSLKNPTGQFDQARYDALLAERRLTDKGVRSDIARQMMAQFLILPTIGASQVPVGVGLPYASLLLERRSGQIAFVPTAAVGAGAPATDAEVQAWYRRNVARYSLPERRVARFARISPAMLKAGSMPSETEIAQAYAANRADYRPTEKRDIVQVTILDEAAAKALAAKVKAGTPIAAAARAAGLEPRTLAGVQKAAYAGQSSQTAADAAFAAPQGGVIGPVRAALGFVVARVDRIEAVPGKTLAEARAAIAATLTEQKTAAAIGSAQDAIGKLIDDDANLGEIVAARKLTAEATPALTAAGIDADKPDAKPDTTLAPIVNAVFGAADGDPPQIVPTGQDGSFAVVALDRIVPAAPRPLAAIRAQVARDFALDRARGLARRAAQGVVAALGKGTALPAALSATGLKLPAPQALNASRAQLAANPRSAQAPLVLMFSMAPKTAKMLEAPNNAGWFVVKLDTIVPGDAARQPGVVSATRGDLGRAAGREYVQQFTTAVRRAVGVRKNAAEVTKLKADLTGRGGSNPQ